VASPSSRRPSTPSLTTLHLLPLLLLLLLLLRNNPHQHLLLNQTNLLHHPQLIPQNNLNSLASPMCVPTLPEIILSIHNVCLVQEFFGLHQDYRSLSAPLLSLIRYCIWTKLRHPFTPLYYFFITYSYKSYLAFGRTLGDYYPKHSVAVPPRERQILNLLGKEAAGNWGRYNEETFVIHDSKRDSSSGRLRFDLSDPHEMTDTIKFFLDTSADYHSGDCLCVISSISWRRIWDGLKKSYERFQTGRNRRSANALKMAKRKPIITLSSTGNRVYTSPAIPSPPPTPKQETTSHSEDSTTSSDSIRLSRLLVRLPSLQKKKGKFAIDKLLDQGPRITRLVMAYVLHPMRTVPLFDAIALETASRIFTARVIARRKFIHELYTKPPGLLAASSSSDTPTTTVTLPEQPAPMGPLRKLLKHVVVGRVRRKASESESQEDDDDDGVGGEMYSSGDLLRLSQHIYEKRHKSMLLTSLGSLDRMARSCTSLLALIMGTDTTNRLSNISKLQSKYNDTPGQIAVEYAQQYLHKCLQVENIFFLCFFFNQLNSSPKLSQSKAVVYYC